MAAANPRRPRPSERRSEEPIGGRAPCAQRPTGAALVGPLPAPLRAAGHCAARCGRRGPAGDAVRSRLAAARAAAGQSGRAAPSPPAALRGGRGGSRPPVARFREAAGEGGRGGGAGDGELRGAPWWRAGRRRLTGGGARLPASMLRKGREPKGFSEQPRLPRRRRAALSRGRGRKPRSPRRPAPPAAGPGAGGYHPSPLALPRPPPFLSACSALPALDGPLAGSGAPALPAKRLRLLPAPTVLPR